MCFYTTNFFHLPRGRIHLQVSVAYFRYKSSVTFSSSSWATDSNGENIASMEYSGIIMALTAISDMVRQMNRRTDGVNGRCKLKAPEKAS